MAVRRHELTEEEWRAIKPLLPNTRRRCRPWKDHRTVLNGMLWILATGAPWRDLPERYGPWQTVYDRFAKWRRSGLFRDVFRVLQERLDADGLIDWDLWWMDGASVRASRAASGGGKRGRKRSPQIMRSATRAAASARSSTC